MTSKDLKRLSRHDLLEMLIELTKENDRLQQKNQQLEAQLQDKAITVAEAGSLAEAVLQLNNVFQAAQDACDQYLYNIKLRCQEAETEFNTDTYDDPETPDVNETV